MPEAILAAACAAIVTALLLRKPPRRLSKGRHLKTNFRGRTIPGTLGLLLLGPVAVGMVFAAVSPHPRAGSIAGAAGSVMCALGLLDDLSPAASGGGFKQHFAALARGHITTGMLKAAGGAVVGLAAAWGVGRRGVWIVVAGAVVALASNLVNLFDLRPGRAVKVWLLAAVALAWFRPDGGSAAVVAATAGGLAVFLPTDLGERGMLGDAGANLIGTVWGVVAVASLGHTGLLIVLGVLLALNASSEFVSFSRVISSVGLLRRADDLGRRET